MPRDILRLDGIDAHTKAQLRTQALHRFGSANISRLVRELIAHSLQEHPPAAQDANSRLPLHGPVVRLEIRLPAAAVARLEERAEARFSPRSYYLAELVLAHLGRPQLHGDAIETLRRSNYEMAKIGTNLNQIAKAFAILAQLGASGPMPDMEKKFASLQREIARHTARVLDVLQDKTELWENRGASARSGGHAGPHGQAR